jgi:hypothetical protein
MAPFDDAQGNRVEPSTFARIAGWSLRKVDEFVQKLGNPVGIKSYKPYNSLGDDFLPTYLGMIGLPIEMVPEYPEEAKIVLLTAQAAADPDFVSKIKGTLTNGGNVFVTSGLVAVAADKLAEIVELDASKSIIINNYSGDRDSTPTSKDILVKQIWFQTNDAWCVLSGGRPLARGTFGVPIILRALYSTGNLYVLTIPEDFGDLYEYPESVLNSFRALTSTETGTFIIGPAKVSLFLYDNGYFILENFNDVGVNTTIIFSQATDIAEDAGGETFDNVYAQQIALAPHQYRVFKGTPHPTAGRKVAVNTDGAQEFWNRHLRAGAPQARSK